MRTFVTDGRTDGAGFIRTRERVLVRPWGTPRDNPSVIHLAETPFKLTVTTLL
jgi:hypothetical protein